MNLRRTVRWSLLLLGVGLLAFVAYQSFPYLSYLFDQNKLDAKFTSYKPKTKFPKKYLVKPMPTKLVIPKMKFNQSIVYASSNMRAQMQALRKGPTHYGGTALPGQIGNVIIGGHYISYTFKYLNTLKKDHEIELKTPIANFKYKVIKTEVVNENALNVVKDYGKKNDRLLTLYTCVYPSNITKSRFLVVAKQIKP